MRRLILISLIVGALAALIWGAGNGVSQAWESHNPTNTPLPIATTDPSAPIKVSPNQSFLVLEDGNFHQIVAGFTKKDGVYVKVDDQKPTITYVGAVTVSVGNGTITFNQSGETINATFSESICIPAMADGQLICNP